MGSTFSKVLNIFMLPLYTSKMSPSEFGTYGFAISVLSLVVPILYFQIWDSVFRFSFDCDDSVEKFKVISNGFFVFVVSTVVFLVFMYIGSLLLRIDNIVLIALYGVSMGVQYFYTVISRSMNNNVVYVISGMLNTIIVIIVNLYLVLIVGVGVNSLYISFIIGTAFQVIYIEKYFNSMKMIDLNGIDLDFIRKMIRFSLPLSLSSISHWLLFGYAQFFISVYLSLEQNGFFSLANKITSIIVLVVGVFQFAWNEMVYMSSNEPNKNQVYNTGINLIYVFTVISSAIFILLMKISAPYFINESYSATLEILPYLIFGTAANAFSGFLGTIFLSDKKSEKLFITTIISAVVNVILILLLSTTYGLNGVVYGLTIALFFGAFLRLIMVYKSNNIHIKMSNHLLVLLVPFNAYIYFAFVDIKLVFFLLIGEFLFFLLFYKELIYDIYTAVWRK